jgi:hypothetical protein
MLADGQVAGQTIIGLGRLKAGKAKLALEPFLSIPKPGSGGKRSVLWRRSSGGDRSPPDGPCLKGGTSFAEPAGRVPEYANPRYFDLDDVALLESVLG